MSSWENAAKLITSKMTKMIVEIAGSNQLKVSEISETLPTILGVFKEWPPFLINTSVPLFSTNHCANITPY